MKKYWQKFLQIFLPNICQLCAHDSDELVCQACCASWLNSAQLRCIRCAHKLEHLNQMTSNPSAALLCGACLSHPPVFSQTYVLGDYATPQDQLIWALKFGNKFALADFFASQLAKVVRHSLLSNPLHPVLLVPIPLSKQRIQQRGYNQAWEITRRLSRLCELPARADGLIKTRHTAVQTSLKINERQRNLRGSFTAQPCVKGQHIALIDDVMTSGTTLNEAARTLMRAGALSVSNYVLLRTPKN